MGRWKHKVNEVKNTGLPLDYAVQKYGKDTWEHVVFLETNLKQEACDLEIKLIAELGYYNIAKGGDGGNTGRNHELAKREQQARSLSEHWKQLPEAEKQRRVDASINSKRNNGTLGNNNPRYGKDHGNWSGTWIVNYKEYTTLKEATDNTTLNEWTIIEYCVRSNNKVYKNGSKYIKPGTTPRQNGYYKNDKTA